MTEYKSISIPKKLYNWANDNIENQGYTSVPDLVKDLLRDWVDEVQKTRQMQKAAQPLKDAFILANQGEDKEAAEKLRNLDLGGNDAR